MTIGDSVHLPLRRFPEPSAMLELVKPITWFPPMWTYLYGIVVLTTSTLHRLMVVELALPAVVPGLLVAFHYGIQISRSNWGFLSDAGGRRTIFILGGMAVLALGGVLAAPGVVLYPASSGAGLAHSVLTYALIGLGVGAWGTSLLALLATAAAPG